MDNKEDLIRSWQAHALITDKRVLEAFRTVRREDFIPVEDKEQAYDDIPLPIGQHQTISQPTTIVMMLQALEVKPGHTVLEIGTGSGYQTALLAELVGIKGKVYTVEYHKELAETATKHLEKWKNIHVEHHDGSLGLPKHAPYDRIIVAAASPYLLSVWTEQLKEKGMIVAPVGPRYVQEVVRGIKQKGELKKTSLGRFVFVPLLGKYGFKD